MRRILLSLAAILCVVGVAQAEQVCFKWGWATNNYEGSAPIVTCDASASSFKYVQSEDIKLSWTGNVTISNSYVTASTAWDIKVLPQAGFKVTEITFGCYSQGNATSMANAFNGSNGAMTASGLTATWKGESTEDDPATLTFGSMTSYVLYALVTYEPIAVAATKAPVCSLASGQYIPGQQIVLTAQEGAEISYSLTNSETETDWQTYTTPLSLETEGTYYLRAKATLDGVESKEITATYEITNVINSGFAVNGTNSQIYSGEYPKLVPEKPAPASGSVTQEGVATVSWDNSSLTWQSNWIKLVTGGKLVITPEENVTITKVEFNCYYGYASDNVTANVGSVVKDGNSTVWTGSADSALELTFGKGIDYCNYFVVEYTKDMNAGGDTPVDPQPESGEYVLASLCTTGAYAGDLPVIKPDFNDGQFAAAGLFDHAGATISWANSGLQLQPNWSGAVSSTSYFKLLKDGSVIVTPAAGMLVKKVEFKFYSSSYAPTSGFTASSGNLTLGQSTIWEGSSASPVTFTFEKDFTYLCYIVVSYEKGEVVEEPIAVPTISPEAGDYQVGQLITITAEEGLTIEYSLSNDENVTWQEYEAPFELPDAGTWTVKARAVEGVNFSEVVEAVYNVAVGRCKLSFPVESAQATMTQEFEAPVLSNPQDLEVVWTSSNAAVATVDENGTVTLVGPGETEIKAAFAGSATVEAGEASYQLVVSRMVPTLKFATERVNAILNTEIEGPALINPQNLELTWSSSNTDMVTVDRDGNLDVKTTGMAMISALATQTNEYEGIEADYILYVYPADATYAAGNGQINFSEIYSTTYVVYEPYVDELTNTTRQWSGYSFAFGADAAQLRSNYRSMMTGQERPSVLRVNADGEFTITAPMIQKLTKLTFNLSFAQTSLYQTGKLSADNGEVTNDPSETTPVIVWTGAANAVKFNVTDGAVDITGINIEYEEMQLPAEPVVGVDSLGADQESVWYTLEGVRVDGNCLSRGIYVVRNGERSYKVFVR